MMFALTPEQEDARVRAAAFAQRLAASAQAIDEQGAITPELQRELESALAPAGDPVALVAAVEELATASAAAAAAGALGANVTAAPDAAASGLRGLRAGGAADARGRLVCAAVACGIARAAITAALAVLRDAKPGEHDQERPHWVIADAATESEAARMLTLNAAQALGGPSADTFVAMAKLAATRAAQQAVDAAVRVMGAAALDRGSLIERLSRDVRSLSLLMGGEEDLRATAAQGLI